ncbi:hypothetical protein ACIOMP_28580 [Pseudomonas protegens]|uniref:hypothetical protein n=1 Tax=Pseudomonas protegens TaxID=380021 RepID=UPI0021C75D06|nr:hypothetical protein [Pseudomonas protegens]MCU1769691.1 hypothetical protein [Pseudomonas protegens]
MKVKNPYNWKDLASLSGNLMRPALVNNFFDNSPIEEKEILEIFRRISGKHNGRLMTTLRAYKGGRSEEHEYKILTTPPEKCESLQGWSNNIFNGEPFAIILNRAERWSVSVADFVANVISEISEQDSLLELNVESVIFMGNYGYSPFGIHQDYDSTKSIHIPLTTTRKSMFLWTVDEYAANAGTLRNCYEPSKLIDTGTEYNYTLGDVFFLPSDYYHIGHSPNFSLSLSIVLSHSRADECLGNIINALTCYYGQNWKSNPVMSNLSLCKTIELAKIHHENQRLSNFCLSGTIEYRNTTLKIDRNRAFSVVKPFKIKYEKNEALIIYIRGEAMKFNESSESPYTDDLVLLIEQLNAGTPTSIRGAVEIVRNLSLDATEYIFRLLIESHMIR